MKKCYKCQKAYLEPEGPGFQEVCEECSSYLHCCENCHFYDNYQAKHCGEPMAEFVSDPNGRNVCEYFRFKVSGGSGVKKDEDRGGRRFAKPNWRNVEGRSGGGRGNGGRGNGGRGNGGRNGGRDNANPRGRAVPNPFGGGDGPKNNSKQEKEQSARDALDNLFKKE